MKGSMHTNCLPAPKVLWPELTYEDTSLTTKKHYSPKLQAFKLIFVRCLKMVVNTPEC